MEKQQVYKLFENWINQRPGLDPYNYTSRSQINSEYRRIASQKYRALNALYVFEALPYDKSVLLDTLKYSFSGRLSIENEELHYQTGQYWPTEYRLAAAVILENYNYTMLHRK